MEENPLLKELKKRNKVDGKELEKIAQAIKVISRSKEGKELFKYFRDLSGIFKASVPFDSTGAVNDYLVYYSMAYRNFYLAVRQFIPPNEIALIEAPNV